MSDTPDRIEFELTPTCFGSKLKINGVELPSVRKVEIIAEVDHAAIVRVEMFALEGVKVGGEAVVDKTIGLEPEPEKFRWMRGKKKP